MIDLLEASYGDLVLVVGFERLACMRSEAIDQSVVGQPGESGADGSDVTRRHEELISAWGEQLGHRSDVGEQDGEPGGPGFDRSERSGPLVGQRGEDEGARLVHQGQDDLVRLGPQEPHSLRGGTTQLGFQRSGPDDGQLKARRGLEPPGFEEYGDALFFSESTDEQHGPRGRGGHESWARVAHRVELDDDAGARQPALDEALTCEIARVRLFSG